MTLMLNIIILRSLLMPRSTMMKTDLLARLYKEKTKLYEGEFEKEKTEEWHRGAHFAYGRLLEILSEYRQ